MSISSSTYAAVSKITNPFSSTDIPFGHTRQTQEKNAFKAIYLHMVFGVLSKRQYGHNRHNFSASEFGFITWIDVYSLLQ